MCVVFALTTQQSAAVDSCALPGVNSWKATAADNDWFNSDNWSTGNVPTAATHVCIQNAPPDGFVDIGTGATANAASIESSQPITISSGELRVNSTTQGSSVEDVNLAGNGATIGGAGTLTVHGTLNWTGDFSNLGDGTNAGQTVIASDGTLAISGTATSRELRDDYKLRIDGTANWAGTVDLNAYNNSTIEIGSGGKLDAKTNQTIFDVSSGGPDSPLLHVLTGGTLTKSAGTATTTIGVPLDNDATTSVNTGTLAINAPSTNSAQMPVAAGAKLELNARMDFGSGVNLSGSGTVIVNATLALAGATSSPSTITLNLAGNGATIGGAGTLTVHGTLNWTGDFSNLGDGTNAGQTVIASDGTLAISGTATSRELRDDYKLRIDGTANWAGTVDLNAYNNSTIEIGSGGKLDAKTNQTIFDVSSGGPDSPLLHVLTGGTLTKSAGTATTTIGVPLDNDATTSVNTGTLAINAPSTNSAQMPVAAGAKLELNARMDFGSGVNLSGSGTVIVNATLALAGATSSPSTITLNLAGNGATIGGAGTLTVHGTLNWTGDFSNLGDGTNAGQTVIASDGTLAISGTATSRELRDDYKLRIDGTANWAGTVDLNAYNNSTIEIGSGGKLDAKTNQTIFDVSSGGPDSPLLHVLTGGTLTKSAGTATTTIGVPLDNDATTSVNTGTLAINAPSTNSAQMPVAAGAKLELNARMDFGSGVNLSGSGTVIVNATLALAGATSSPSTITLNLAGNGATIGGAGTLTVHGTLNWTGDFSNLGDGTNAGQTVIASDGTLAISGTATSRELRDDYKLRIDGTANWAGTVDLNAYNNSTIEIGSGGKLDAKTNQTIFDVSSGGPDSPLLHVLTGGTLTKSAGTATSTIGIAVTNDGTIDAAAGTLYLNGTFTNYNTTTGKLTGGAYKARNNATFRFNDADVRTNAADITLDGNTSRFWNGTANGLRNFQTNDTLGKFQLRNGNNFTRAGATAFTNNGLISLAPTTKFTLTSAPYNQGGTGTLRTEVTGPVAGTDFGQLAAAATTLAGALVVDTSDNSPSPGNFYDLVTGTRTGTFANVTVDPDYQVAYLNDRVRLNYAPGATAPETTIDDGPAEGSTITDPTPTFEFSSSEPGSTFECSVDGGASAPCTSPRTLTTLADGEHTFEVRAFSPTNVPDPTPASRTFTVDATAPNTTITGGPAQGSKIKDGTPTFTFTANEPGSTFECAIDGASAACTSPHTLDPLSDGSHTFTVQATDAHGNTDQTPAARTFTVDTVAPDTTITSGPSAGGNTSDTTPAFGFTSSEPNSSFECKVDAGAFAPCTSPHTLAPLTDGQHTFRVRATDPAGNQDPSPAERIFTVDANPPTLTISDPTVAEPDSGSVNAVFTLTLSRIPNHQVTVNYATKTGSAAPGSTPPDFTATSGQVTFAANQSTKTLSVAVLGDLIKEPTENFSVQLSNAQGAILAETAGVATITDDDICTKVGTNGNDTLTGVAGQADYLCGLGGNDFLRGGDNNDTLEGAEGNDSLDGGAGNDNLVGGVGTADRAYYLGAPSGITVNLALTGAQSTGGAGADTISGVENILGSGSSDSLTGSGVSNVIEGGAGTDTIAGAGGDDFLVGGTQADDIGGGIGSDYAVGDDGADEIRGGDQIDLLRGGAHDDEILGGVGDDAIEGQAGDDRLAGGDEAQRDDTSTGRDYIGGQSGADLIFGQDGNDCTRNAAHTQCPTGGTIHFNPTFGWPDNDDDFNAILIGHTGRDHLYGGTGSDRLDGGDADQNNELMGGVPTTAASGDFCSFGGVVNGTRLEKYNGCEIPTEHANIPDDSILARGWSPWPPSGWCNRSGACD